MTPIAVTLSALTAMLALAAAFAWFRCPDRVRPLLLRLNRRSAGLRERVVTVDGHRVQLLVREAAQPGTVPVLLLHGIFAEKDHWVDFARALPKDWGLVIPDLPGFGESDRLAAARYGYAEQLPRLLGLMDALGLPQAHLAGSSMGGALATQLAAQHPQRVASLALIGAPHGLRSPRPSPVDRLIDAGEVPLVARDAAGFDALLRRLFHRRPWIPYPVLQAARRDAVQRAASNRRLWGEHVVDRYRLPERLGAVRGPVLALWGEHDQVFDASGAGLLHALLPQAEVRVMPQLGHLPMMEAPTRTARLYTRFVAECA
jgi:pimeloyl-ACP methyl ester carboxylesterase